VQGTSSDLAEIASSKRLVWYLLGGTAALLIAELFIGFSITARNATLAGLVEISYPIFIALFSYILFKNHVTAPTVIGGIIIFAGVFVIYYFNH
jgi:drug/metabolite transporter (DMT)-like permease